MRTTVTLEPDVESLLRHAMRRSGKSFKDVLNRAVREGLAAQGTDRKRPPFRVRARPMGLRSGLDAGALNRLLDELDVEAIGKKGRRGA